MVLANVSASILEDLITFIYCGEVNVCRESLGELLETGQLLNIKGLADVKHSPESKSKPNKSSQLNSHTIIKINDSMTVQTTSDGVNQEQEPMASASNDFNGFSDDLKPNVFEVNNNNICDGMDNEIPEEGARSDSKHLHRKRTMTVIHDPRLVTESMPPKKLSKLTNGKWI